MQLFIVLHFIFRIEWLQNVNFEESGEPMASICPNEQKIYFEKTMGS